LANVNVYRFSTKEIHVGSGLYYYGYRFYDPSTQRWVSRDPLGDSGFRLSSPQSPVKRGAPVERFEGPNLYAQVRNRPLDRVDALGLGRYCGSAFPSSGVRDDPGGYDFSQACKDHDKCYDTCGASKKDCDEKFLQDMLDICEQNYG